MAQTEHAPQLLILRQTIRALSDTTTRTQAEHARFEVYNAINGEDWKQALTWAEACRVTLLAARLKARNDKLELEVIDAATSALAIMTAAIAKKTHCPHG